MISVPPKSINRQILEKKTLGINCHKYIRQIITHKLSIGTRRQIVETAENAVLGAKSPKPARTWIFRNLQKKKLTNNTE
jgi:hypothetical protein